ncbi:MAG: PKD domain-containing protein [Bacteroides sp.]|nr:PKD domain-containing protein [Bacteroides sp.]
MRKSLLIIGTLFILLPSLSAQEYYKVKKQTRISSGLDEAAAVPYDDGLVYITETTSVGASSPTDSRGRRLFTMFRYQPGSGQKKQFIDALVTQGHEGPVSFTGDFKTMVFAQQRPSDGNREFDPLGLYFADDVDGDWTNIRAFEYNDPQAWLFSPALSRDGKTLFFSSNLDGGEGGFDLYVSHRNGELWSKPENLGPKVNSPENEIYPCVQESGRLVFSTEGRDNDKAGYDLFETVYIDGEWIEAIKLLSPLNSLSNDYHAWFNEDMKSGYLTSDRQGGSKDIFEFSTDIPAFETVDPIRRTYYKYRIYDRKLDTVDESLFTYSWTINDTLTIPGHNIIYRFPGIGTYVCKLNVFDIQLDTLVEGQTVKTLNIYLNEQAVISCPDTIVVGSAQDFDASQSYLPGFDVGRYVWDFGEDEGALRFGQGITVSHTYNHPGTFKVILGVEERKQNRKHVPQVRANFKEVVVIPR